MTTYTWQTFRSALGSGGMYWGISCGDGRHLITDDEADPVVAAQKRINAAKGDGKPPAAEDLAAVSGWLDRHLPRAPGAAA